MNLPTIIPVSGDPSNLDMQFDEAAEAADQILEEGDGQVVVFQLFKCSGCGVATQTMEANTFNETGHCYECEKDTNLRDTGCGFVVAVGDPDTVIEAVADATCGKAQGNA